MLELKKCEKVIVELSSAGGEDYTSLAFYSRIKQSPCFIHIHAIGLVASAAVLILAAGDKKTMAREGWAMVHESSEDLSGEVHEIERAAAQLRRMEDQAVRLLELNTHTSAADWMKYHKETTFFNADQCLKLGLVDEVI